MEHLDFLIVYIAYRKKYSVIREFRVTLNAGDQDLKFILD